MEGCVCTYLHGSVCMCVCVCVCVCVHVQLPVRGVRVLGEREFLATRGRRQLLDWNHLAVHCGAQVQSGIRPEQQIINPCAARGNPLSEVHLVVCHLLRKCADGIDVTLERGQIDLVGSVHR